MKQFLIFVLMGIIFGCAANKSIQPNYSELVVAVENEEIDSLQIQTVRDQLIKRYPDSEKVYEFAASEFYDLIYPVWKNDSLKVEIIQGLLEKYPQTNWRRSMFQYLTYSLWNLKQEAKLIEVLEDFRVAFSRLSTFFSNCQIFQFDGS